MSLRFSIVIPAFNALQTLGLLFRCLKEQTFSHDCFECIIVDDGSTDGTEAFLRQQETGFRMEVIRNCTNLGRSAARNLGWRRASGEIVVFLDADMLPVPEWLAEYDCAFVELGVEVLSGARYCVTVAPQECEYHLARMLQIEPRDLFQYDVCETFRRLSGRAKLGQYPTPLYKKLELGLRDVCKDIPASLICAFSFITSNVAVYRHRLEETAGFCSFIVRLHDTELGLQLWESGCRFSFADSAAAYHLYYPVTPDPNINYTDSLSMFYRHPYKLALMMVCWGLHRAPVETKPSLAVLAQSDLIDVDITEQYCQTFNRPLPVNCQYTRESMITYASERSGLSREEIALYLETALARGLFVQTRDGEIFFDRYHTINYLQNNTHFRQAAIEVGCCFNKRTALRESRAPTNVLSVHCQGRYDVVVHRTLLSADTLLTLPLPIEHSAQRNLKISGCSPPNLLEFADLSKGVVSAVPLNLSTIGDVTVGYDFECDIQEVMSCENENRSVTDHEIHLALRSTLPPSCIEKARVVLRRIFATQVEGNYEQARSIYRWILDHVSYREGTISNTLTLEVGFGTCLHAAKLFVELCRLIGIPAREQCGALLERHTDRNCTNVVETHNRGFSPFMHTWAEFYDGRQGWVPVEFLGWLLGRRSLSTLNVGDQILRARVEAATNTFDDYFFGNLDPYRIRTSSLSNKLITYPVSRSKETWEYVYQCIERTRHQLKCYLRTVPTTNEGCRSQL